MQAKKFSMNAPVVSAQWSTLCERLCQASLLASVTALALWLGWGIDRGLELTDEAFYVLTGAHPHSLRFFFTPTQWLAAPLWAVGGGLSGFRVAGWTVLTGSAAVLAAGAARTAGMPLANTRLHMVVVIAAAFAGAWLYGAVLNFSPSYNLLSAAGAYLALGLFLLASDRPDKWTWKLQPVVVGVVLGLTTIAKFSTGICMAGVVLGLHPFMHRSVGIALRSAMMTVAATVLTVFAVGIAYTTPEQAWEAFREGLTLTSLAQQSEPVVVRLARNWEESKVLLVSAGSAFVGPLLGVGLAVLVRRPGIAIVAAIWFSVNLVHGDFLLGGMDRYLLQSVPLTASIVAMLLLTVGTWARGVRMTMVVGVLVALPFLIALGTGNPLPFQIVLSMAPWGLLCGLLASSVPQKWRVPGLVFSLIFVGIAVSQIISGGLRAPYRLAHPLTEQTTPVDLAGLGRLHVDIETARFLDDVKNMQRACDVKPGMGFLGLYGLPGLAVVLDAVPLDTPWLFAEPFATAVLAQTDRHAIDSALVGIRLDGNGVQPQLPPQLAGFPRQYRKCGTTAFPFESARIELWAPIYRGGQD